MIPAFTGGTLQIDTTGSTFTQNFVIDGSTTNRLDQRGNSARLTGVLADAAPGTPGNLTIANTGIGGRITFAGTNTYTGLTTIEAGATLAVDGAIVSPVSAAGTLGGTGTVGNTTIVAGGTLAPGNSIGTLTVQGNTGFAAGATYAVEVSPTTADRTNATGTATLDGTLRAIFETGSYTPRRHTALSAASGRTGTFATLSTVDLPPNFAASLDYTATDALLNLSAALGSGSALSPNQANVAAVINTSFNAASSLPSGLQSLYALSGPPLADALNSLSGEAQSGAQLATFTWGSQFLGTILASAGPGGAGPQKPTQYASLTPGAGTEEPGRLRTWMAGFGGIASLGGADGSNGARTSTQGVAVGGDWSFENTTMGIAVAGGRSNWSLDGGLGSGGGDVFQGAVYGRTGNGPWYAAAIGAWGYHAIKTQRPVPFLVDQLSSSHSASTWSGRAETGLRLAVGKIGVTPFVAAQAQLLNLPGFCETSRLGNGAALCFDATSPSELRSELGIEGDADLGALLGGQSRLRVRVAWAHEYQATRQVRAAFQALPGSGFTVSGAPLPRDMAIIRVVSDTMLDNIWSFRLQADTEMGSRYALFSGTARLAARW